MMVMDYKSEEELDTILRRGYIEELEAYCKTQGYSKEQTEIFVQNTLKHEEVEAELLGE